MVDPFVSDEEAGFCRKTTSRNLELPRFGG